MNASDFVDRYWNLSVEADMFMTWSTHVRQLAQKTLVGSRYTFSV